MFLKLNLSSPWLLLETNIATKVIVGWLSIWHLIFDLLIDNWSLKDKLIKNIILPILRGGRIHSHLTLVLLNLTPHTIRLYSVIITFPILDVLTLQLLFFHAKINLNSLWFRPIELAIVFCIDSVTFQYDFKQDYGIWILVHYWDLLDLFVRDSEHLAAKGFIVLLVAHPGLEVAVLVFVTKLLVSQLAFFQKVFVVVFL